MGQVKIVDSQRKQEDKPKPVSKPVPEQDHPRKTKPESKEESGGDEKESLDDSSPKRRIKNKTAQRKLSWK